MSKLKNCTFYNKTLYSLFSYEYQYFYACFVLIETHALGFCSLESTLFKCLIYPRLKSAYCLGTGNDAVGATCLRLKLNYRGDSGAELSVLWMPDLHLQPFISPWPADRISSSVPQLAASGGWLVLSSLVTLAGGGSTLKMAQELQESFLLMIESLQAPLISILNVGRSAGGMLTNKPAGIFAFTFLLKELTIGIITIHAQGSVAQAYGFCSKAVD